MTRRKRSGSTSAGPPRGARGDGRPARALLRPRLRLRVHPGHRLMSATRPGRGSARACSSSPRSGGRGAPTPGSPTCSTPTSPAPASSSSARWRAMLVAALAIPEAFGDDGAPVRPRLLRRPRTPHLLLRLRRRRRRHRDRGPQARRHGFAGSRPADRRGGFLDGGAQASLWIIALIIDYAGPPVRRPAVPGVSPRHFAERFGLIIIIVLGESIVAVGIGLGGVDLGLRRGRRRVAGIGIAARSGGRTSTSPLSSPSAPSRRAERRRAQQDGERRLRLHPHADDSPASSCSRLA